MNLFALTIRHIQTEWKIAAADVSRQGDFNEAYKQPAGSQPGYVRLTEIPDSTCHERRAENQRYDACQFQMNDGADGPQLAAVHNRRLNLLQGLSPGQELDGRIDREKGDDREE